MASVEPPARRSGREAWATEALRAGAPHLLLFGTPREVLARIVPEDGLGLRERIAQRLVERALLCDVDRLLLRAQALCAQRAPTWRGAPELASWLEARVEEAIAAFLTEEVEPGGESQEASDWGFSAVPLGLDPVAMRRACARFNRLSFEQRSAFFALVLDAAEPDRLARAQGLSLSQLARRARTGLELFRAIGVGSGQ